MANLGGDRGVLLELHVFRAITGDGFTDAADHAALRKDGLGALDGLGLPAAAAGDQERG